MGAQQLVLLCRRHLVETAQEVHVRVLPHHLRDVRRHLLQILRDRVQIEDRHRLALLVRRRLRLVEVLQSKPLEAHAIRLSTVHKPLLVHDHLRLAELLVAELTGPGDVRVLLEQLVLVVVDEAGRRVLLVELLLLVLVNDLPVEHFHADPVVAQHVQLVAVDELLLQLRQSLLVHPLDDHREVHVRVLQHRLSVEALQVLDEVLRVVVEHRNRVHLVELALRTLLQELQVYLEQSERLRLALEAVVGVKAREHRLVVLVRHVDAQVANLLLQANIVEHLDVLPLVCELHHRLIKRLVWVLIRLHILLACDSVFDFCILSSLESGLVALAELWV